MSTTSLVHILVDGAVVPGFYAPSTEYRDTLRKVAREMFPKAVFEVLLVRNGLLYPVIAFEYHDNGEPKTELEGRVPVTAAELEIARMFDTMSAFR